MKKYISQEDLQRICFDLGGSVNRFNGKTILISGAAGFLGGIFMEFFRYINSNYLSTPCKMIGIDNFIIGVRFPEEYKDDPNIRIINHDITHPLGMQIANDDNVDFVISASGLASPKLYRKFPEETMRVSLDGTVNMLRVAYYKNAESVITFSSSEVYVTPPDDKIPTPETYVGAIPTNEPRSCYDIGKLCVETMSSIYFEKYNVPVKVIRPFNVYGPCDKSDTRVIPNFIKSILNGESLKVYGENENTRTFCYVSDAITGFLRVLLFGKNNEIYNIGNPSPEISMFNLASLIKNQTNYDGKVEVIPYPAGYPSTEPRRRCPDISKASSQIGYTPRVKLQDGVENFFKWAQENWK
jgi:UDP-glucuronate decarboxylase